jgi:hypothetical protein
MIVKVHEVKDGSGRKVVAVCDEDLVGKRFEDKNLQLDLGSEFYKGERKSDGEVSEIIKKAYIVNFVGKKSVALGIRLGVVNENKVVKIKQVPHAQAIL